MRHLAKTQRIRIAFLHELYLDQKEFYELLRIHTNENTSDLMTKDLDLLKFQKFSEDLSIVNFDVSTKKIWRLGTATSKRPVTAP